LSRQKRLSRILEIVVEEGSLEVEQVAKSLGVSLATIRRDLDSLAQKQLLSRTHGGAVAMGGSLGIPLAFKQSRRSLGQPHKWSPGLM
jgi:DeoR family transcriptional regulator, aga operon transcriptional repressor